MFRVWGFYNGEERYFGRLSCGTYMSILHIKSMYNPENKKKLYW